MVGEGHACVKGGGWGAKCGAPSGRPRVGGPERSDLDRCEQCDGADVADVGEGTGGRCLRVGTAPSLRSARAHVHLENALACRDAAHRQPFGSVTSLGDDGALLACRSFGADRARRQRVVRGLRSRCNIVAASPAGEAAVIRARRGPRVVAEGEAPAPRDAFGGGVARARAVLLHSPPRDRPRVLTGECRNVARARGTPLLIEGTEVHRRGSARSALAERGAGCQPQDRAREGTEEAKVAEGARSAARMRAHPHG